MGEHAETHFLDVIDFEIARSVHRIVRAMHDGECPKCHRLFQSKSVVVEMEFYSFASDPKEDERCPNCGFTITRSEIIAALEIFGPVMEKNLEVFEDWRRKLKTT